MPFGTDPTNFDEGWWLNPIEMLWRHFRREVTHGELFVSLDALLKAAHAFFDRYNQSKERVLSIMGAHAA